MSKRSRLKNRPAASQTFGRRVEQLESRCLLASASLLHEFDAVILQAADPQSFTGGLATELFAPQLQFHSSPQSRSGLSRGDEVPNREAPNGMVPGEERRGAEQGREDAPGGIDSFVPPLDVPVETPDEGGQIDVGGYGDSAGGTSPSDVRDARESRAVLEMLARLKYSVAATADEVDLAEPVVTRDVEGRTGSVLLDQRTIDIAVSELAEELDVSPLPQRSSGASLLDIDVPMDRSAGRFQVFEVLMIDPAAAHSAVREALYGPSSPSAAAAYDFDWIDPAEAGSEPEIDSIAPPLVQLQANVEPAKPQEGISPLAMITAFVDEKLSSTWNRALALLTFGLMSYLCRVQYRSRLPEVVEDEEASTEEKPARHSGWFARYFKFASRIRAAASS
jgi:hypothetical protein